MLQRLLWKVYGWFGWSCSHELFWCGCVRKARWHRCVQHGALDHDEEPVRPRPATQVTREHVVRDVRRELWMLDRFSQQGGEIVAFTALNNYQQAIRNAALALRSAEAYYAQHREGV
jgi:hypothetical protein